MMREGKVVSLILSVVWWWSATCTTVYHQIKRRDGVEDTTAIVGRFFNCSIPVNAFEGDLDHYKVTEAGETTLPQWLHFDEERKTFQGVPSKADIGSVYISVKAIGKPNEENSQPSVAKDVFSIEVNEAAEPLKKYCLLEETETLTTIVLNVALDTLSSVDKIRLLSTTIEFLQLEKTDLDSLSLFPLGREESALDPRAFRAGGGNAKFRMAAATRIVFPVGCSGKIWTASDGVLMKLEKTAVDGTLADTLGHPIVGWQVVDGTPAEAKERQKRNVTPFRGTLLPAVRATLFPLVTEKVFFRGSSATEEIPKSRIVPTMATPGFSPPSHHHRHHHGEDRDQLPPHLRREDFYKPTDLRATPTWKYHAPVTARPEIGGTLMPTPVLYPERPTAVVYPSRMPPIGETGPTIGLPPIMPPLPSDDLASRWYAATSDYLTMAGSGPTRSIPQPVEPTRTPPQASNFMPKVNRRMKKLSLVSGKAWSYTVPRDTFLDWEDGDTRRLKLMFTTMERTSIPASSWIQFDPENQLLYALPLDDSLGKHEYVLEAMDEGGASTFDRVELHVWPHPLMNSLTHSFAMTVRYNKWQYPVGIDWQTEVLNRLALFFGDPDNAKLVLISVTLDPVRITWANDSLPERPCPVEEIATMYEALATEDRHPTKETKKLMHPEFRVQEITVSYKGSCEGVVTSPLPPPNFSPKLTHPIHRINVTVGDVFQFKIPEDMFYDFEDGGTRHLRLSLKNADNQRISRSSWLQFDARKQELYGIAFEENVGRREYQLEAMDVDGHSITDSFEVHVQRLRTVKQPPVHFSIYLEHDFEEFMADASKKTSVALKLSRLYGDSSPRHILVTRISRGSVVYTWSNKTLSHIYCDEDMIRELVSYLAVHGEITNKLARAMEPEFRVIKADSYTDPTGVCSIGKTITFLPTTTPTTPGLLDISDSPDATVKTMSTTDDIYLTTVLPAAVIASMLLVAAVVAYCLYWKKRKGGDKAEGLIDKEFVGGGVPVVFAGELEEFKQDLGKTPAIMPNEKPPLTTDYLLNPFKRGAAAVRESVAAATQQHIHPLQDEEGHLQQHQQQLSHQHPQHSSCHHHHHSHHDEDYRERGVPRRDTRKDPALYQPPPPFAHGRPDKGTRPKAGATYSRHPTYVPP